MYASMRHTKGFALLLIARVGGESLPWVRGYSMYTRVCAQALDKAGH